MDRLCALNDFETLPAGDLRAQIFALPDVEGVGIAAVLVADASRRTTTLNAYVSGFGGTRRVVVYDTLIDSMPREQALSVVAHELAHAAHGDVLIGTSLDALGGVAGVGLLTMLFSASPGRWGSCAADPSVVPLLLALMAFASLVASPLENGISRPIETRADVDALAATGHSEAFVDVQRNLALRSLADPTPPVWTQFWWGVTPRSSNASRSPAESGRPRDAQAGSTRDT